MVTFGCNDRTTLWATPGSSLAYTHRKLGGWTWVELNVPTGEYLSFMEHRTSLMMGSSPSSCRSRPTSVGVTLANYDRDATEVTVGLASAIANAGSGAGEISGQPISIVTGESVGTLCRGRG